MTQPRPKSDGAVPDPAADFAVPAAAAEAIGDLTARERAVLRAAARSYWQERVSGPRAWSDPDDLLQEALVRTLQGSRRWRTSVSMAQHLIRTMESISWDVVRARRAQLHGWSDDGVEDAPTRVPTTSIVPELVLARDELERLEALFDGDPEALEVLRCRAIRLSPSETCARLGMERGRYDTVNKRIWRALTTYTKNAAAEVEG